MKLMEAVPNFSEGRRTDVINAIVQRVADVSRAKVLNVDSNADANRTVLTLAGEAQEVRKSALELLKPLANCWICAPTTARTRAWGRWTYARLCRLPI